VGVDETIVGQAERRTPLRDDPCPLRTASLVTTKVTARFHFLLANRQPNSGNKHNSKAASERTNERQRGFRVALVAMLSLFDRLLHSRYRLMYTVVFGLHCLGCFSYSVVMAFSVCVFNLI